MLVKKKSTASECISNRKIQFSICLNFWPTFLFCLVWPGWLLWLVSHSPLGSAWDVDNLFFLSASALYHATELPALVWMLFAIFIQFAVRSRLCLSETHDDEECWSTTECAVHTQRKSSCGSSLLARREIALVNRPKLPASSHSIVNRCTRVCERLAHNTNFTNISGNANWLVASYI